MLIRIILAVAIIAAVIDAGVFFSDYFNRTFAADALNSQIESENQSLAQLRVKTRELNAQIAENNAAVEKVMTDIASESRKIPQHEISSNEIIGALLKLGQEYQVSIIPLTTRDWSVVTTTDYSCRVLRMSAEVLGEKEQVILAIKQLPQLYSTLVIENISLNRVPVGADSENTTAVETDRITAKLTLAFYAR